MERSTRTLILRHTLEDLCKCLSKWIQIQQPKISDISSYFCLAYGEQYNCGRTQFFAKSDDGGTIIT